MRKKILIGLGVLSLVVVAGVYYMLSKKEAPSPAGPTLAYQELYKAVKGGKTDEIRKRLSKATIQFAEGAAARQKVPIESVLKNGFLSANLNASMPATRDERIKGNFAAVEIWSDKNKNWENAPFVKEDGSWKLAVGELFSGKFQQPGKPRSQIERENANAASNGGMVPYSNTNLNANTKMPDIIKPKLDNSNIGPNPGK